MGRFAFWTKKAQRCELGVYLGRERCWVVPRHEAQSGMELPIKSISKGALTTENWAELFSTIHSHFGPANLALVLGFGRYQLFPADKPGVAGNEVLDALRWTIKDMVTEPVTSLKLDYFESPNPVSQKVTVVAVSRGALLELVGAADKQGFGVVGIGIEELLTPRLFTAGSQARLVLSHIPDAELLLTVIKDGKLWLQRRVRGFSGLERISEESLALAMADSLSLELQRSMDYFESQLRQAPVTAIELVIEGAHPSLPSLLAANFNQQIHVAPSMPVAMRFAQLACDEFFGAKLMGAKDE